MGSAARVGNINYSEISVWQPISDEKVGADHLSWLTGWCPAARERTCCGAAAEHPARPTAPSLKTLAGCKTTEFHQGRLIPSRHPHPSRRDPAGTWRRSGAPQPGGSPAGSSGPWKAPYSAPESPGCQNRCTSAADGSRCSSAGGCCRHHLHPERFSPTDLNFPTARRLVSPS